MKVAYRLACTTLTMSNISSTRRSDTQPFNADAYLDLESTPPPPRKRTLNDDDDDYHPTVDAQGTSKKGETEGGVLIGIIRQAERGSGSRNSPRGCSRGPCTVRRLSCQRAEDGH